MVHEVLAGDRATTLYPVQQVKLLDGIKTWLLDRAAAAELPKSY